MLSDSRLDEVREYLEKAQNPIFFYDNDADGFCSYIILRRFLKRGKGVAIKSYPDLQESYLRKVDEFNSDLVVVLDKPLISKEFVDELSKRSLPLIWLDHHDLPQPEFNYGQIFRFNSSLEGGRKSEPTTSIAYNITRNKEDSWIAVMGCIADHNLPFFLGDFVERYPEFWKKGIKEPFEAYYNTEIGQIAQSIGFGLKDSISNVVMMQNFFIECKSPKEVLVESSKNEAFRKKIKEIKKKYYSLLDKAKSIKINNLLFFTYSGDLSISSELANELSYLNPGKYIVVAFLKGNTVNISMRGKDVSDLLGKVLKTIEGASGGGHQMAVGARMRSDRLEEFKEMIVKEIDDGFRS
jgi:single-stranded DNA-specific DHH superfamily exonuclease